MDLQLWRQRAPRRSRPHAVPRLQRAALLRHGGWRARRAQGMAGPARKAGGGLSCGEDGLDVIRSPDALRVEYLRPRATRVVALGYNRVHTASDTRGVGQVASR